MFCLQVQLEVVTKFSEVDLTTINKKSGFLAGIVRRYAGQQATGYAQQLTYVMAGVHATLTPAAQAKLNDMMALGTISATELTPAALASVAALPVNTQCEVMDRFAEADLTPINNKSGFLQGIVKRYDKGGIPTAPVLQPQPAPLMWANAAFPAAVPAFPKAAYAATTPSTSFLGMLEQLFASRRLAREDYDVEIAQEFSTFTEDVLIEILQKYAEADLSTINSKKGFLKGIIKRCDTIFPIGKMSTARLSIRKRVVLDRRCLRATLSNGIFLASARLRSRRPGVWQSSVVIVFPPY